MRNNTQRIIAAAATWGRVAEREGYSELGLPEGEGRSFGSGPCLTNTSFGSGLRLDWVFGEGVSNKSLLLKRLMDGKEPLVYKPPTINSYPWYEIIESPQSEYEVSVGSAPSLSSMLSPGASPNESCISINGALWRIEETIHSEHEYIVSWGKYPMKWRLFSTKVEKGSVEETCKYIRNKAWNNLVAHAVARTGHMVLYGESESEMMEKVNSDFNIFHEKISDISEESIRGDINFEIDADDVCWEKRWVLQRIGLSGWPYAGEVLAVEQKSLKTIAGDNFGDAVLFRVDPDDQSSDPAGEAWIRIEQDAESNTSRYVSMYVSAQSKLEQKIQNECGNYLKSLLGLAMSREGAIFVMDRSESNKEILRLFRTRARPDTKY